MKERPILFSGPMVRAIREGRKTQTRRAIKFAWCGSIEALMHQATFDPAYKCPYGKPGDRLWARETWGLMSYHDTTDWCRGSISGVSESELREQYLVEHAANWNLPNESAYWRPSIHMPRWASRIALEIVGVRVERLQDISNEDCWNEGMCDATNPELKANRRWFSELWESINGPESWNLNPWVWVIEFKEVKP